MAKAVPLRVRDLLLVASSIAMAAAGWNWAKATEYRHKTAGLEGRERELAADLARVERESRSPRLFPPRIFELTRTMLDHAVHGQLDRLAARLRAENQNTTQLVLDQCVTVADCIVNGRSAEWPPSEADLRMIAAITSCMENPEYSEVCVEPQPRSPIPSSTTSCLALSSAASASTMCFVPETRKQTTA